MTAFRRARPIFAAFALSGCVAYPAAPVAYAPPPRPVYVAPAPVYVAPRPPPRGYYVAPHARRVWVPRQCDRHGRCRGGYWR